MSRKVSIFYLISGRDTFSGTGIDRVSKNILSALSEIADGAFQLIPVTIDDTGNIKANNSPITDHGERDQQRRLEPEKDDIVLSVDLVYNLSAAAKQRLTGLRTKGVKLCFILYDLIPVRRPEWFATEGDVSERQTYLKQFQSWVEFVFRNADSLSCISKFVCEDAALWKEEHAIRPGPSLLWFHLGCDFKRFPARLSDRAKNTAQRRGLTFVLVGTLEPRKSQSLVLDAFEHLWTRNPEVSLVIAGRSGKPWMSNYQTALVQRIESHPELNKRLHFVDGPTDQQLQNYYSQSAALIMASEDEGFGLPLIEAAQSGLPLVVRDIPVFREICGGSAYYFTANDGHGLAGAISSWLTLFKAGKHPASSQLLSNTWRQSAQQLLEGLRSIGCSL